MNEINSKENGLGRCCLEPRTPCTRRSQKPLTQINAIDPVACSRSARQPEAFRLVCPVAAAHMPHGAGPHGYDDTIAIVLSWLFFILRLLGCNLDCTTKFFLFLQEPLASLSPQSGDVILFINQGLSFSSFHFKKTTAIVIAIGSRFGTYLYVSLFWQNETVPLTKLTPIVIRFNYDEWLYCFQRPIEDDSFSLDMKGPQVIACPNQ